MNDILVAIVDDEPTYVHVIDRVLQRSGFRTIVWLPGTDPVELIRRERPQVVVLDMHLAGKSGATVLEMMRGEPELMDTCVLLCSGAAWLLTEQVQRWGSHRLATLEKPFDLMELVKSIQQFVTLAAPNQELRPVIAL